MTDCNRCGAEMEPEPCWSCGGEGGYHDCGEDTCCCIDKERITHDCGICNGDGYLPVCVFCSEAA